MAGPVNANIARTMAPPVMEARRWIEGVTFPEDRPLINLSQAAPVAPPPKALRRAMADMVMSDPGAHLYGPVLGLPALRGAVADRMGTLYRGQVSTDQVAITAGCNEAFTAILATLAAPGDEVILPVPWYFNHKMALDMAGVRAVPLQTAPDLTPDAEAARALITPATRAMVLVTPNNPAGVAYGPETIAAFRDVARAAGIALIVDETYRDFMQTDGAPHGLFEDPDWDDVVIHLYSFSKAYRLTGHRVGAIATSTTRLAQVEKYLDTVTICAPQLGQRAALWGMEHLGDWLAGERLETLSRRNVIAAGLARLDGWQLVASGAYFAYVRHPFDLPSPDLARHLVHAAGLLMLPGTMFRPSDDTAGGAEMRIAFANAHQTGLEEVIARLDALSAQDLQHPAP